MTVVVCGRTNLSERAEAITRAFREQQGFRTEWGCGRTHDLDNPIQHMQVARCLTCLRWMCRPCLAAHFEESADSPRQGDGRANPTEGGPAYRLTDDDMAEGAESVQPAVSPRTGTPRPTTAPSKS